MAADSSIVILIDGDDSGLKEKLNRIGSIASGAAKAAVTAIAGISTALAGAAAAAVKAGAAYETSLAKVSTIADTSVSKRWKKHCPRPSPTRRSTPSWARTKIPARWCTDLYNSGPFFYSI